MNGAKVLLKRKSRNFNAGFCVMNDSLPSLLKYFSLLHPDEQKHYHSLKFERRKASYLLGRIVAKKAVYYLTGIENSALIFIDFGVFQFPVIKSPVTPNIQVSISHCDNIGMAVAFPEDHPMGIDIEKIDEHKLEAIKTQLSKKEEELMERCNLTSPIGGTLIWTIKEALSKLLRTGLTTDFKIFEIQSLEKTGSAYLSSFLHFSQYKGLSYSSGNYVYSLVLPMNTIIELEGFWDAFINSVQNKDDLSG